jgi:hypothetical protein
MLNAKRPLWKIKEGVEKHNILLFLGILGGLALGPLSQQYQTVDVQVLYIKCDSICMQPTHILLYSVNHLLISYNTLFMSVLCK